MHQGIEFFTATCLNWQMLLKPDAHKQIILNSLEFLVTQKRIWLYGYVIMHNHVHILWCEQNDWLDKDVQQQFSKFTGQQLKFSLTDNYPHLLPYLKVPRPIGRINSGNVGLTNPPCINRTVLEQKLDYIHMNPVKAELCQLPEDYVYSSAGYYITNAPNNIITHYMEHM